MRSLSSFWFWNVWIPVLIFVIWIVVSSTIYTFIKKVTHGADLDDDMLNVAWVMAWPFMLVVLWPFLIGKYLGTKLWVRHETPKAILDELAGEEHVKV